jgi:hypothetical protein
MDILFAAIVLALVCLLVIGLVPSWDALSAQLGVFFSREAPPETGPTPIQPIAPVRARKRPHADTPARGKSGKRHTVVPHQARGR